MQVERAFTLFKSGVFRKHGTFDSGSWGGKTLSYVTLATKLDNTRWEEIFEAARNAVRSSRSRAMLNAIVIDGDDERANLTSDTEAEPSMSCTITLFHAFSHRIQVSA